MFNFFKKKKKEEKKETPVIAVNTEIRGMYCPVCGYMEVDPSTNELPMEGFALCANCGAGMKTGVFRMGEDGKFSLVEKEDQVKKTNKRQSGGHYRVRPHGPNRGKFHGHFVSF